VRIPETSVWSQPTEPIASVASHEPVVAPRIGRFQGPAPLWARCLLNLQFSGSCVGLRDMRNNPLRLS
jgi:hypothetical protein